MGLKNKNIIILFVACCFLKCSNIEYSNKIVLTTQIISKIDKYNSIFDSSNMVEFRKVYLNAIDKIINDNSSNMFLVERILFNGNKFTIEFFYSYGKKNNSIKFATNKRDSIIFNEFTLKYYLPKLSLACDQHYFYYNKILLPEGKYDSYSILFIKDAKLIDTKIFLSEKFDKFNNTDCNCKNEDLKEIIRFINSFPSPAIRSLPNK